MLQKAAIGAAIAATIALAPSPAQAGPLTRAGLVDIRQTAPRIELAMRYATADNFTGAVLPGYCKPIALLRRPAATALAGVERHLHADGYGLTVYDAYRPARATHAMVRWAQRSGKEWVLRDGWVARRSNHNRGAAVDLTLTRNGKPLDMGTGFDSFTTRSYTANVTGKPLRNRLRLKRAMESRGFRNYHREWWHYDYPPLLGSAPLDIPIGC